MGSSTTARCPTLLAIFWREGGPLDINEYLYLGNQRMARALNFSSSYYYYADYLGTSRASVDENGNKCYDADYFPWGNEQDVFVNTCTQNYKFNGKELDPDMGVYDFGARFFQDGIARFYQPDFNEYSSHPSPVPYAKLNNPQSLNLYTYVLDNPLSLREVDGHKWSLPYNLGGEYYDDLLLQQAADAAGQAVAAQQQNTNTTPAHFEYSISTGELWKVDASGNATFVSSGYSGKGNGLNNPYDQDIQGEKGKADAGPIPAGTYTIGKMFDNTGKTGPGSMRLTPDAGNEMNGRSGFLIHGDNSKHNFSASEGCIILSRSTRDAISSSGITRLEVNANLW